MAQGIFGLDRVYKKQVQNIKDDNFESWPESATYGYFGGGNSSGANPLKSTVDRIDFYNETTSAPGNNLTQERYGLGAVSNDNYGYFGGGYGPSVVNTVDRIDFSNETLSAPTNNLPQARNYLAAVSSSSYGYFGGGFAPPYVCTIDRLDFSNDTVLDIGDLSQARYGLEAVSSNSYGYFGGGQSPPHQTYVCTIDRLDFSNETTSAPGTGLPEARRGLAAVSN